MPWAPVGAEDHEFIDRLQQIPLGVAAIAGAALAAQLAAVRAPNEIGVIGSTAPGANP